MDIAFFYKYLSIEIEKEKNFTLTPRLLGVTLGPPVLQSLSINVRYFHLIPCFGTECFDFFLFNILTTAELFNLSEEKTRFKKDHDYPPLPE